MNAYIRERATLLGTAVVPMKSDHLYEHLF